MTAWFSRLLAVAAAIAIPAAAFAQSSPAAGRWDLAMTTPIGERKSTMTVTPADGGFVVTFAVPEGAEPARDSVSEVVIDGSRFSFKRLVEIEQGQIELDYAGTVEGDVLTGKVKSPFGEFDLKGVRASQPQ